MTSSASKPKPITSTADTPPDAAWLFAFAGLRAFPGAGGTGAVGAARDVALEPVVPLELVFPPQHNR